MRHRLRWIETRVLPRGWTDVIRQVLLFLGAYLLYQLVRGLVDGGNGYKPFGDATKIIHLERVLHIFIEPSVQAWASSVHWLMDLADWTYLNAHYLVTLGALVFIYLRRNDSFYFVRNMFMIAMAIALVGYALYPTAPPRLMPEWGFTDSVAHFMGLPYIEDSPGKALLNFYAAVPSMHVCFAVMIGVPMSRLVKRWWGRVAWGLYPLLITFVVVATGNHYLTDVILGALTAGASALLAGQLLARARPDAWAFGQAPA
ncbi:MAG: phosphatase PAP2 family protein [Solirubrobacteraceae bacterium]